MTRVEWVARHQRAVIASALAVIAALAWAWLLFGAGMRVSGMHGHGASGARLVVAAAMWIVMMVAMMLPSAAPMILLYGAVARKTTSPTVGGTGAFTLGYLVVWTGFALAAASLQVVLQERMLLTAGLRTTSAAAAGALLVAAGLYQLTPLKHACLRQCRTPVEFITSHWRPGALGAFRMGVSHGRYCLGCCWMLMALLFASGVMNLLWIAAIALVVLIEKVTPQGALVSRAGGIVLTMAGGVVLWTSLAMG